MNERVPVETELVGFFRPDFIPTGRTLMRVGPDVTESPDGMLAAEDTPPARIYDARQLQAEALAKPGASEARFFEDNGFVLLSHDSAVEDWDVDAMAPDNPLSRAYHPEVAALIQDRLLPGHRLDMWQGPPLRRGPGTLNPDYAGGIHQDFGLVIDDYQEALEAFSSPEIGKIFRARYDQEEVIGLVAINFWRTVGMKGPLRHMPLAFCHPRSIDVADVVPVGLIDFAPTGRPTNQTSLRYRAAQRWFYYPEMTAGDVLAFKQFQTLKVSPEPRVEGCFHSAFELPNTPADAEVRQSCEHRVTVFLLDDPV